MFLGRLFGWLLVVIAVAMASADAVMALGPLEYNGIVAGDVLTLLTGGEHEFDEEALSVFSQLQMMVLDLPAWIVMGALGAGLTFLCRPRQSRYRFRRG